MQILSVNKWNHAFFSRFCELKSELEREKGNFNTETIKDLADVLDGPYFKTFKKTCSYAAYLILGEGNDTPCARVICFHDPSKAQEAYFGYLEFRDNSEAIALLFESMENFAKEMAVKKIFGPIQANIFISYRLKVNDSPGFFREQSYTEHYQRKLQEMGYCEERSWHTHKLLDPSNIPRNLKNNRFYNLGKKNSLRLWFFFPWRSKVYLKKLYQLFMESYSDMPNYEKIDFATFQKLYGPLIYLINPFCSFLIRKHGEDIGFCVAIFDPTKHLHWHQTRSVKKPNFFYSICLLLKLVLNREKLLIMHIGKSKVSTSASLSLKVYGKIGSTLISLIKFFRIKEVYLCHLRENSPILKTLPESERKIHSQYTLFYKIIS